MLGFFWQFFFKLFQKCINFINSDDRIGKISLKSIRLIQFLLKNKFKYNKKGIIYNGKIRNSGNHIYDFAHSFFGKDFKPNRYTGS